MQETQDLHGNAKNHYWVNGSMIDEDDFEGPS